MEASGWKRIQELFVGALELPIDARATWLREAEKDPALVARVEELLAADLDPATVLEVSAPDLLTTGVVGRAASRATGTPQKPDTIPGAAASPSPGRLAGRDIGPYRLLHRIGHGGMGAVYLAEHREFEQRVALKIIKRGMDTDEIVRRFAAERQLLARLEHPNVARLLDGGVTDDGLPWFSMEYVDGRPIDEFCAARDLPIRRRLELFAVICDAVQYAHAILVVHRDLKPGNILVTGDGKVKLLDFGIAKVVGGDDAAATAAGFTRTGVRPMTPAYAAPEQVRGEAVTTATDVYSLGVILWELIAGERLHRVDLSTRELELAILESTPARPGRKAPGARSDLDDIVLAALRKEPERRYGSAGELAADVRRYLRGFPVHASADSAGYRVRRFIDRNRAGVAAAVAVAILLLGTVAWYTTQLRAERDRAQLEAQKFQSVASYFSNVIEQASPRRDNVATVSSPTVDDLLAWAVEHADDKLGEYPEAHASVLADLGFVTRTRGDYERALPTLEKALDIRLELLGEGVDNKLVQVLSGTGTTLAEMGRYDEAESYFRRALDRAHRYPTYNGYAVAFANNNLAKHLVRMGRYEEAIGYLDEAERVYVETAGPRHSFTAVAARNGAMARFDAGQLLGIDSVLFRSLRDMPMAHGEVNEQAIDAYMTLARLRRLQARPDEALAWADSALGRRRALPRAERSEEGRILQLRGLILVERGRTDEGLADLAQGDSLFWADAEPEHPLTYGMSMRHGMGLRAANRPAEAERLLRQAIDEADAWLPPGHPERAAPRFELGLLALQLGRAEEAEALAREALEIQEAHLPDGHWRTARTRGLLGLCLLRRGAVERTGSAAGEAREGRPLLADAGATLSEMFGAGHPYVVELTAGLAAPR